MEQLTKEYIPNEVIRFKSKDEFSDFLSLFENLGEYEYLRMANYSFPCAYSFGKRDWSNTYEIPYLEWKEKTLAIFKMENF